MACLCLPFPQTASGPAKGDNFGRNTLVKQRPTALPDLDDDTPRVMLRRIIRTRKYLPPGKAASSRTGSRTGVVLFSRFFFPCSAEQGSSPLH